MGVNFSHFQVAALFGFVAVASAQVGVHRPYQHVSTPIHAAVRQPVTGPHVVGNVVPHHVQPIVPVVPGQVRHVVDHVENADNQAQILRSEAVVNPDSFQYEYETSNGIAANEAGQLKQFTQEEAAVVAQGAFRWTAPDGTPISIQYVADETGYHPTGDHLPVAPPVPDHIGK